MLALQHYGPEVRDVQQVLEHLKVLDEDVHLLSGVCLPQLAKEGRDLNKVLKKKKKIRPYLPLEMRYSGSGTAGSARLCLCRRGS